MPLKEIQNEGPKGLGVEGSSFTLHSDSVKKAKKRPATARKPKKRDSLFDTTTGAYHGAIAQENFQEILSWARPDVNAQGNLTFRSQWGDSLSKDDKLYKKYMKSSYQMYNEEVHGPKKGKAERNSEEFFSWIKRQQLYYNDIINPEIIGEVDKWFASASTEDKRRLLDLFSTLHTVTQPSRMHQSTMQANHRSLRPSSARPSTYNLDKVKKTKESKAKKTRPKSAPIKAKPKEVIRAPHPSKDDNVEAKLQRILEKRRQIQLDPNAAKNLYKSAVPLAWGAADSMPRQSTYFEMHGKSTLAAGEFTMPKGHDYKSDFSSPFGMVNEQAKVNKTRPTRKKFMIPASFLQRKSDRASTQPGPTTYRMSYMKRSQDELKGVATNASELIAESKKALYRSYVPLGNKGITDLVTWKSTNKDLYKDTKAQLAMQKESNSETASSIRKAFNGPTACIGTTAPATFHKNKKKVAWY